MSLLVFVCVLFMENRRTIAVTGLLAIAAQTLFSYSAQSSVAMELAIRHPSLFGVALMSAVVIAVAILMSRMVRWIYLKVVRGETTPFI